MKNTLIGLFVGILIGGVAVGWYTQTIPVIGVPAQVILEEPTETVACTELKVYKQAKKKKVGLPKELQKDDSVYLADATLLQPNDHYRTVSAAFFSEDQRIKLFVTEEPYPWFKVGGGEKYVSVSYGPKVRADTGSGSNVEFVSRLSAGISGIRIKAVKLGFRADVDTDGDLFGAAEIKYSWR